MSRASESGSDPGFEELLYFVDGRAEQWVGEERRVLVAGDVAHVPMDVVHGTYNVFDEPVTFLAMLSPATWERACGPLLDSDHFLIPSSRTPPIS